MDIYNSCLTEGTFPPIWKRQRLVLIPKKGKPNEDPSSYRPLCMLDTVEKIPSFGNKKRHKQMQADFHRTSTGFAGGSHQLIWSNVSTKLPAKQSKVIAGCMALKNTA